MHLLLACGRGNFFEGALLGAPGYSPSLAHAMMTSMSPLKISFVLVRAMLPNDDVNYRKRWEIILLLKPFLSASPTNPVMSVRLSVCPRSCVCLFPYVSLVVCFLCRYMYSSFSIRLFCCLMSSVFCVFLHFCVFLFICLSVSSCL